MGSSSSSPSDPPPKKAKKKSKAVAEDDFSTGEAEADQNGSALVVSSLLFRPQVGRKKHDGIDYINYIMEMHACMGYAMPCKIETTGVGYGL
jgi:hypothetical protein